MGEHEPNQSTKQLQSEPISRHMKSILVKIMK